MRSIRGSGWFTVCKPLFFSTFADSSSGRSLTVTASVGGVGVAGGGACGEVVVVVMEPQDKKQVSL